MRQGAQVSMSQTASPQRTGAARAEGVEERELIERVRGRELAAFERLYRLYQPRLTRFLSNVVQRPQVLEEVVDDTMMVVWQRPDSFHGGSKLSTWIFAIAYRKALKGLKRCDDPIDDPEAPNRACEGDSPEDSSENVRRRDLIAEAMKELSPAHRAVVDLTYYHELDYNEIATILDCPVGTVKTRMFHARRQLRRIVDGGLEDWV